MPEHRTRKSELFEKVSAGHGQAQVPVEPARCVEYSPPQMRSFGCNTRLPLVVFVLFHSTACAQSPPPERHPADSAPLQKTPEKAVEKPVKLEPDKPKDERVPEVPKAQIGEDSSVPIPQNTPYPRHNEKSALGTNLTRVRDWFSEYAFVDEFKRSRPWFSGSPGRKGWQDARPLDLDENGWPRSLQVGQVARTLMFWGKNVKYPAGDYTILYDGTGKLEFENATVFDQKHGRIVIRPNPEAGGFALAIAETSKQDPVRNIRVLLPGGTCAKDPFKHCIRSEDCGGECIPFERNYRQQIFHPLFLDLVKSFSTLRFTDWMDINENDHPKSRWELRPKLTDAQWTKKGVPIEIITDLSNRLTVDPWLSIPHDADDEYVQKLAEFMRDNLRPGLRAYVEHSNEVWNNALFQAREVRKIAMEQKLAPDPFRATAFYHSRRSVQIFKIFEKVMGKDRIVRVMGSFIAAAALSDGMLDFEGAAKHTDVVAVASYFGFPQDLPNFPAMTIDQAVDYLKGPARTQLAKMLEQQAQVAKKHKVKLVAYEGGDHLDTPHQYLKNENVNNMLDKLSRDPRVKDIYLDYLKLWKDQGGTLYNHFTSCAQPFGPGRFGAVEYLHQDRSKAPKWLALKAFLDSNPRWW